MASAPATTQTVESLLGIKTQPTDSRLGFANAVFRGLPIGALERIALQVAPNDVSFKHRLVPKATLERRRKSPTKLLTADESDRLARLAKVYAFALSIFKEPEKVREFLNYPHAMLDGKAPVDVVLANGPGADVVINILGRAAYGGGA